jgi:hypothetical protein
LTILNFGKSSGITWLAKSCDNCWISSIVHSCHSILSHGHFKAIIITFKSVTLCLPVLSWCSLHSL